MSLQGSFERAQNTLQRAQHTLKRALCVVQRALKALETRPRYTFVYLLGASPGLKMGKDPSKDTAILLFDPVVITPVCVCVCVCVCV